MIPDTYQLTIPAPRTRDGKADWLRANGGHGNRYARADLIRNWRGRAAWAARAARLPRIETPVHIVAIVHRDDTTGRHWDAGNWAATAKACVDGLQLHPKWGGADVLRGDCNCWVTGPDMRAGEPWADAALVLRIEVLEEAA